MSFRPKKIAFIGTKGVPATWGGIEKYVEESGFLISPFVGFVDDEDAG